MSQVIRRSGRVLLWTATLLALVGMVAVLVFEQGRAAGAETPAEVDPVVYGQVQQLRRDLSLENGDLAAMGLTPAQAEAFFEGLLSWCEGSAAAVTAAERAELDARRTLREATRKVRVGPRDEALMRQLPRLQQAAERATATRLSLLETGARQALAGVSSQQLSVWDAARANAGVPGEFKYVSGLREHDQEQIRAALRDRAHGVKHGKHERALRAPAAEQARQRQQQHLPGVIAAEAKVLPTPEGLGPIAGAPPITVIRE